MGMDLRNVLCREVRESSDWGRIGRLADCERLAEAKGGLAGRPENPDSYPGIYFFEGFFFP
jgi:hypothetical protein